MDPAFPTFTLLLLDTGPGEPAWNMAVDEALLVTAANRAGAVLRFYGWTEPAATFGYSQRLADVERQTRLRPVIRRPTGGGIVPHDRDWTYSLAVPPGLAWYTLRAPESYRAMHAWVVDAFARLGVTTELAPCCRRELPGQCFAGYELSDVLWHGRKIGGAAQRRNQLGLLIQGSIQPPPGVDRAAWQCAMGTVAPAVHFSAASPLALDPVTTAMAGDLAASKYRQPAYNGRR